MNDFYPRSPWGERPCNEIFQTSRRLFLSTLPVGGATHISYNLSIGSLFLSTLPVGGATGICLPKPSEIIDFYPRSPWGERLHRSVKYPTLLTISIHAPRGGSDHDRIAWIADPWDFYPRSPWGERLNLPLRLCAIIYFYPRSPWGERRGLSICVITASAISIHAPRGGSDK